MVGVHAGINVRDDAGAGDLKCALRVRNADDCRGGLAHITVPYRRAEIINRSLVSEARRSSGYSVQAAVKSDYLIELGVHDAQRISREIEESRQVKRAGDQEEVILGVAESTYYGAGLEKRQSAASRLKPLKTKSRANDEAIIGGRRCGPHENEKQTEEPLSRLHEALPRTGRSHSRASKSPATRLICHRAGHKTSRRRFGLPPPIRSKKWAEKYR